MSSAPHSRLVAILLGAFLLASAVPAQEAAKPPDAAPAVEFVELLVRDRVEADGFQLRRQKNSVRILTAGGLAQYSQVGVPFFESNEEPKLELLQVTKPDGRELDLLASAPTNIASVFPVDLPIYSDLRMLRAAVPSLEIGDVLSFETSVRARPIAEGQVWIEMNFADPATISSQSYELDTPIDSLLTVHVRADLGATFEETRPEGRWIRRWTVAGKVEPATTGDPTQVTPAPSPPEEEVASAIQITSFRSWNEFGNWWASLAPPMVDAAVRAKANELTAKFAEPKEKLRALHRYVAQEIRYLALPLGIARYRAREPGEVMSTGLGDCKDKSRLLASLAQSIGIEVDSILIYAGAKRKLVEEAPSPLQFDHVIGRARIGSEEIWMDPTAEMVPMGSLPKSSRGRHGVALLQPGNGGREKTRTAVTAAIVETPARPAKPPSVSVEISGALDASGHLHAKVRWAFEGDDEIVRLAFKYGDEKDRRTALESFRREWNKESTIGAVANSDPNDIDRPFWLEYEVDRPMPTSTWRKAWEFWVPTPLAWADAPPSSNGDPRGAPQIELLEFRSTARQRVTARIEFPEGVRISPPVPLASLREFADFRSDYRVEGRSIVLERELTFKVDSVPRAQFDDLKAFREVIASDYQQEFDVAAAPQLAPAEHSAAELTSDCRDAIDNRRNDEAERLCREAIALDPRQEDVWSTLGLALERQGRIGEAKAAYQQQVEINPRHSYAYASIGVLAWASGDTTTAEKMLRKQVEIAPLVAFGYAHLGRLLFVNEHFEEGESMLRRAARLDPDDTEVLENLLELEARRGRFDSFAAMLVEHPTLGRDLRHLAANLILLSRQTRPDWSSLAAWLRGIAADAEGVLRELDRPRPTKAEVAAVASLALAWEGLARAASEGGRTEEALALLDAAIDIGHLPSSVAGKSEVLRVRGDTEDANLLLAIAIELGQPDADFLKRRLETTVPVSEERSRFAAKAREEAWKYRSSTREVAQAADEQGEVWILFGEDGNLLDAAPAAGSKTAALIAELKREPLRLRLPASNRARVALKALAYCSPTGECTLTLEPPGQTWMSMQEVP